ncbi:hypothetical protein [Nonomuraea basaltis]|nr:hypothetical protein [Nonomuraea basaltis]
MRVAQRFGHRKDALLKHCCVVRIGPDKAVVDDLDIDFGDGFASAA